MSARKPPPITTPPPVTPRPGTLAPDRSGALSLDRGILTLARSLDVTSLWRWAWLSLLTGAIVGLAACAFYFSLELVREHLLYGLAGFHPPMPAGDQLPIDAQRAGHEVRWLLVLLPAAGGLAAGLLSWRFAPEAAGHGTDAMIDAYHKGVHIPLRVAVVKAIASIFTLGTGGSAGREGPISQIGAGFGSTLGRWLSLTERERRLLLLAGAAGGIAALFRTPLGASLWAMEVLYREDFESEGLFPCLTASVTAYSIFISIFGPGHLFATEHTYLFRPSELPLFALMAALLAALGVVWIRVFYGTETLVFARLPGPRWLRPAIGGLALGLLALAIPQCLGIGYGWVQEALRPLDAPSTLLPAGYAGAAVLAGIALSKMLATSLTVGSGGSGGVFAPSIVIGGLLGGAFGVAAHQLFPHTALQPGAYALVGMAAFYGGVGHVPLASLVIVCELAGSYDLLVPLMLGVMITYVLLRRATLYQKQVKSPRHSPVHADEFTVDVLEHLSVADVLDESQGMHSVPVDMRLRDFLGRISSTAEWFFTVVDKDGRPVGVIALTDVHAVVDDATALDVVLVGDAMRPLYSVAPSSSLRTAVATFIAARQDRLPVIDPADPTRVLGIVSQQAVMTAYNAELLRRKIGHSVTDSLRLPAVRPPPV